MIAKSFEDITVKELLPLVDTIKQKLKDNTIIFFVSKVKGKVQLLLSVSKDLQSQYKAGNLIKELAKIVGGSGGGKPDMAQAGGKLVEKIPEVMAKIKELLK